ncbi:aldo/keto reductase [Streptomyces sp. NPDC048516]|uniref:aldo/keto reductase n=1 Tax=Streptomyces sp. NPDC048516 TaxID=3365565 RepID=UPI0037241B30
MRSTTIGPDGPEVCRLGLGLGLGLGRMSMTGSYGTADLHEAAATVLAALDSGVTMFDTGDFYGHGAN